jgi:V/A-type H+-transporting ATPase subunit E
MGLQDILESIRAVGDGQVGEIEAQARIQVYEIMATARMEAEDVEEAAYNAAVAPAAKERARILHRARLDAMHRVGQTREGLIDATLQRAQGILTGLRTDRAYPDVLCRLLEEALRELGGSDVEGERIQLSCDPRDRSRIESLLNHLIVDADVSYNLESWGGLVARSQDGQISVSDTLESRLERAKPILRRYLAAWFEEEDTQCLDSITATPAYTP